jgi:hypothetical protein
VLLERLGLALGRSTPPRQAAARRAVAILLQDSPQILPFASWRDPREIAAIHRARWPADADQIVARAEDIVEGRLQLLGYSGIAVGDPVDWHLEPLAGVRAPCRHWSLIDFLDPAQVGDHKLIWELNRHHHLVTLAQAYWLSGERAFPDTVARHLESWMDQNPPHVGVNWASSLELALRSIAWIWTIRLLGDPAVLPSALLERLGSHLEIQGRHIERHLSLYFAPNTHLLGEALGLLYLGTCLPQLPRARRWRALGSSILMTEGTRQVLPDGVYYEQSTFYQRYVVDFYLHASLLCADIPAAREAASFASTLQSTTDVLAALTRRDGTIPLIGDDDGGQLLFLSTASPADTRGTLAAAGAHLGRSDFTNAAGGPRPEALWLIGPSPAEQPSRAQRPPPRRSQAFRNGGIAIMRDPDPGPETELVVDVGPHGPRRTGSVHSHADALSVLLSTATDHFLVDPGTYTYTLDAGARRYFRSAESHNTLTIDGHMAAEPKGPFHWRKARPAMLRQWASTPFFDWLQGTFDGFSLDPAPTHSRTALLLKGLGVLLWDEVSLPDSLPVTRHFHLAEHCRVRRLGGHDFDIAGASSSLRLRFLRPAGTASLVDGWVSPVYGRRVRAPVIRSTVTGQGTFHGYTLLIPHSSSEIDLRCTESDARVRVAGTECTIILPGQSAAARAPHDGVIGWHHRADPGTLTVGLIGGTRISLDAGIDIAMPPGGDWCVAVKENETMRTYSGTFHS